MMRYAVQLGLIEANPAHGVDRLFADGEKQRALSPEELARIGEVLERTTAEGRQDGSTGGVLIRFIAMTGLRKGEALFLLRSAVKPEIGCLYLSDSKSGPQLRAVGRPAFRLLASTPTLAGTDLVFWGSKPGVPCIGVDKVFRKVCVEAQVLDASLHTLRHTFATVAHELGYNEFTIAGLLGHRSGSVTGRYVHPDITLLAAADQVSSEIEARLTGSGPPPLKRSKWQVNP